MSIQQSGVHMETHLALAGLLGPDPHVVEKDTEEGRVACQKIHDHYQANRGENTDIGIEMDHRHRSCVYPPPVEADGPEPLWSPEHYIPSTFVGCRAPHVFLKDGTPIFDKFGEYWTLFEFANETDARLQTRSLLDAATAIKMPLEHVVLYNEENARKVWQADLVLIRPDGHVAWRGQDAPDVESVDNLVKIITGHKAGKYSTSDCDNSAAILAPFAATEEVTSQVDEYKLEQMGVMQT